MTHLDRTSTVDDPGTRDRSVPLSVTAALLASIALLIASAVVLALNANSALRSAAQVANTYEVKWRLLELQALVTAAEAAQRGYLLTGRTEYLRPYFAAERRWQSDLQTIQRVADHVAQKRNLEALGGLLRTEFAQLARTIAATDQPGPTGVADVAGTERAKTTMDSIHGAVAQAMQLEDGLLESRLATVREDTRLTLIIAMVTTAVAIAVLIALYRLARNHLVARANAEHALRDTNVRLNQAVVERTAELTQLSQHLLRVTEQEKAQLSRELHDTLGANLTAINMDVNWVQRRLKESDPQLAERLQRALNVLAQTVELKRVVIEGLRPATLDHLGLGYAMRLHCEDFAKRTGVPCYIDVTEDLADLDPSWSIALYRIAQEALTNVSKHAHASEARILLERGNDGVRLRVIDDGMGVSDDVMTKPGAYGLIGMRERVRQLGGTFAIRRGHDGRGTVVEALIPLPAKPRAVA